MSVVRNLLIIVVLVAAGVFVTGYILRPTATVAKTVRGKAVMAVPGSVTVRAEYDMPLVSEIGGRIVSSNLDPGKLVKKGAVLAQLDTTDLKLEIERIESEEKAAESRIAIGSQTELDLQNAQESYTNFERLTKAGSYPEAELIKQRRLVQQIEQRVELERVANQQSLESFKNSLNVKRRQLEKMTIVAPFDGVVSEVYARPGQFIGDRSPIALLIANNRTVEAKISEENFAGLAIGLKASVSFLGYGDQLYTASVAKILPTADPTTQRYIVHLDVDIPAEKLVPGITGEVSIVTGERNNALIIPRRALFGTNVYVVNDGRIELRQVKLGYVALNMVEILSGLEDDEIVVVDEIQNFRQGDRVKVRLEESI